MTITTFDGVLAGAQKTQYLHFVSGASSSTNKMFSHWNNGGTNNLSNGKYDITTAGGVVLNSTPSLIDGMIPHFDPAPGKIAYVSRFAIKSNPGSVIMLADRLWHCGCTNTGTQLSVTSTAVQNVASVTWPPRDEIGSTNGVGVFIGVEVGSVLGAGVPVYSITGYDQNKQALVNAQNTNITITTAPQGFFMPFRNGANTGSQGVSNVTTFTGSVSSTSGMIVLVAYRPLMYLSPISGGTSITGDPIIGGFPQIYNGAVPFILEFTQTAAARSMYGTYTETQG